MKKIGLLSLLCLLCATSSWAWRGGWGWRGGVYLGGPWWPYWYPDYYYPNYDPYYPSVPYAGPVEDTAAAPRSSLQQQRDQLNFQYEDGDISKEQRDAGLRELDRKQAEEKANPAPASRPSSPRAERSTSSPEAVNDLLLELRTLLDVKLKDGSITKAQHDAEASYLDRIEKQAGQGADSGTLVNRLHQAYYAINHNLIVH